MGEIGLQEATMYKLKSFFSAQYGCVRDWSIQPDAHQRQYDCDIT